MKTLNQSFEYTGSDVYDINNVIVSKEGVSLFDSITGIGGVDYMPSNGDVVTIKTGGVSTVDSVKLEPSLNNKIYYLVTDEVYTSSDKDEILSLSEEVIVSYDSIEEKYIGSFVFNNPNNYNNIYIIWDYANNLKSGVISYTGPSDTKYIDIDYGSDIGSTGINYEAHLKPSRFTLRWNGEIVADSGYVGLNSTANYSALISAGVRPEDINLVYPHDGLVDNGTGNLRFSRLNSTVNNASLRVMSPLSTSSWIVDRVDPTLTPFYIDIDNSTTVAGTSTQIADTLYYHSGANSLPEVGDFVYSTSNGDTIFYGADSFHSISTTLQVTPPTSGGVYVLINNFGEVIESDFIDCQESSVPFISQEDITVFSGNNISIKLRASSNPSSWSIVSDLKYYILTGGNNGSIFTYTDKNSISKNITVSNNSSISVASIIYPTLTFGDGVITIGDIAYEEILPSGATFDRSSGTISGSIDSSCGYSFEFVATNCVGDSVPKTIAIISNSTESYKPFAIDVENFGGTGDAACVISPIYSLLYHNGNDLIPKNGDIVFTDINALYPFMGGSMYYKIDHSTYTIKICENGEVCDTHECPTSTTTTTTTTSTTTTTTLPSTGLWYTATLCSDPSVSAVLYDSTSAAIIATNTVKTEDGNCWTISGTTTSSYPFQLIENPAVIYASCTTCLGITTTTTTTTTTTAPIYTSFDMSEHYRATSYLACTTETTHVTFYHNGLLSNPIPGDFVFTDALGLYPFDGEDGWYYMPFDGGCSVRISVSGQVLNVINCYGVTTTTTTTTIPTYYYSATKCSDGTVVKIKEQSFTLIDNGNVVRGVSGECYTIVSNVALIATTDDILFIYSTCLECQGVTTTTTTTTTTTSTTTEAIRIPTVVRYAASSPEGPDAACYAPYVTAYLDGDISTVGTRAYYLSSGIYYEYGYGYIRQADVTYAYGEEGITGTTYTCSPLTEILVRADEDFGDVCSGTIETYYISGPLSTVGTKVYYFNGTSYSDISYRWLLQLGTTTAYEYDEGITGDTYICS